MAVTAAPRSAKNDNNNNNTSNNNNNNNDNENQGQTYAVAPDRVARLEWFLATNGFCNQAVVGPIMGVLRHAWIPCHPDQVVDGIMLRTMMRDHGSILEARLCEYLNSCWHQYFRNEDQLVRREFDQLQAGPFKGMTCVMHHVLGRTRGALLLTSVRIQQQTDEAELRGLRGVDAIRNYLFQRVAECGPVIWPSVESAEGCRGDEMCDNSYDGSDFLTLRYAD